MDNPSLFQGKNYLELEKFYLEHPIALYTGAGISYASDDRYGLRSWDHLILRILSSHPGITRGKIEEYQQKCSQEWADQPWAAAQWVAEVTGENAFKQHVIQIIQREDNFQKKYKLLSGHYLKQAPTLLSVSAFCASFAAGQRVPNDHGRWTATYRAAPNLRVQAVISSNYDPYLEAASSLMFRNPVLKPVGTEGSSIGNLKETPVFHIHGYVPFPAVHEMEKIEDCAEFYSRGVVTQTDYEKAWRSDDVFCFTMGPQIHILRHYSVLFIGFSFRDAWVNQLLADLNRERERRVHRLYHYALMLEQEILDRGGDSFFETLGVRAIPLQSFAEVSGVLKHLYSQGLIQDHGQGEIELPLHQPRNKRSDGQPVHLSPDKYVEELRRCRIGTVFHK